MGCKISKMSRTNLNFRDFSSLASETMFSIDELESLYVLFKKLSSCIVDDGFIHKEEFRQALLRNNGKPDLFVDRVFDLFDIKHKGVLNFGEFVKSLSIFHPKSPTEDKILFTFKLYDLRNKGYIEREEVKEMVVAILEESDLKLPDDIVDTIVEKAFVEADSNLDGRIDLQEWKEFVSKNPSLLKNMTIPYLMDVNTAFPSFVVKTKKPSKVVGPKKFYLPMPEKNNSKGEHNLVSVTYRISNIHFCSITVMKKRR